MEEIIKKIIDIEYKAQSVIDDANQEKEKRKEALKEKLVVLEEQLISDAKRKIGQLRTRELDEALRENALEEEKCTASLVKMDAQKHEMEKIWKDELVTSVLKR